MPQVENGNIIASYPVPPSSRFLGPPCSIRGRAVGQIHRKTYCAVKREYCHIESFETSRDDSGRPTSHVSPALRDQESPITLLELISGSRDEHVLVVQRNGTLSMFSQDLDTTLSESSLSSHYLKSIKVLAAKDLALSEARKTILKHRADVLNDATPETTFLAVAYSQDGPIDSVKSIRYGIWGINVKPTSDRKSLYPVVDHELFLGNNGPRSILLKDKSCSFNSTASNLFVHGADSLFSYDLTGLVPVMRSTLHISLKGNHEIMAISPAFAVCSSEDSLRLYDLNYQAVQALTHTKPAGLKRRSRMRGSKQDQRGTIEFVAYYPRSARIIGRRRHQLLAIDISVGASRRLLETGRSLLQNVGRGHSRDGHENKPPHLQLAEDFSTSSMASEPTEDWKAVRQLLDQLGQAGDFAGFEKAFHHHIRESSKLSSTSLQIVDELPVDHSMIPDFKLKYLLSVVFQSASPNSVRAENGASTQLTIRIPSLRLLRWLSLLGSLSERSVEKALEGGSSGAQQSIGLHGVAQALVDADPSYGLLIECIENGYSPYVDEQAAVVQLLIRQALATTSETVEAGAGHQLNGATNGDVEMQVQTFPASTNMSSWLPLSLQRALVKALDRFGSATTPVISAMIKSKLSQTEALALIQFLRQQLFQGGYTRSFPDLPETKTASGTVRLDGAVKVLSSCVDTIGPLGFVSGFDNEDFIGNIVPELVSEIKHTKESLEDVLELQGILREALRYQQSVQKQQAAGARIPILGASAQPHAGAIVTVYSEAVEGQENLQPGPTLPLGLKVEGIVSPAKVRKGGGQVKQRSFRQKRMLERRTKGQYSFERLVL